MKNKIKKLFQSVDIPPNARKIFRFQFCAIVIGVVNSVIIARVLGPASKGVADLFLLIGLLIIQFGSLGINNGLLFFLAKKKEPLPEIHGIGIAFSIGIGIIIAVLGVIGIPALKTLFPSLPDWAILGAFLIAPFILYRFIWSEILTGMDKAVSVYRFTAYFTGMNLVGSLFLWAFGELTFENIIKLIIFLSIVYSIICFKFIQQIEPAFKINFSLARKSINYGLIIYLGTIGNAIHFKADQVMISYFLGVESVGLYTISVRWAEMLLMLDNALIFSSLYKICSTSTTESHSLAVNIFKTQLLISGVSGLALALLAYPLINILYGKEFLPAILPLIALIPGIIFWSVARVFSTTITYNRGMASFNVIVSWVGATLNIILNLLFYKYSDLGIIGFSIASSISYFAVAVITFIKFIYTKEAVMSVESA